MAAKSEGLLRAVLLGAAPMECAATQKILRALKLGSGDVLVGVDGGTDRWLECGHTPDLAVGDWDSLRNRRILDEISHVTVPHEKNESDLFLAAGASGHLGVDRIVAVGVTGGRPDHHLASLYDLSRVADFRDRHLREVSAIGPEGTYHFLTGRLSHWKARLPVGQVVSIFAFGPKAQGVSLKGFKYSLTDDPMECSSIGLSNETVKPEVEVELKRGRLVIMIPSAVSRERSPAGSKRGGSMRPSRRG